jgi:hypothetical protein
MITNIVDAGSDSSAADSAKVSGASELRAGDHETFVQTELLQRPLCGASRPHFFKGVATVFLPAPYTSNACCEKATRSEKHMLINRVRFAAKIEILLEVWLTYRASPLRVYNSTYKSFTLSPAETATVSRSSQV